ncbi:MAG: flagellar motor switch protein FliG [Myxococcales bacterium]|nr:flagellar motor switch protein FliG [Myxococcales bacterium]
MEYEALAGAEKAAIVILSLPSDQVRDFLSQLEDDEVEKALAAVSRMDEIPSRVQQLVLQEFQDTLGRAEAEAVRGGRKKAVSIVEGALDQGRAARILEHLGRDEKRIDWTLRSYQPAFIADRLESEHPQTIALVLSQMPSERGAAVIEALPEPLRPDIVLRLASLEPVSNEVISELELGVSELFERKPTPTTRVGGAKAAASMLNRVPKEQGAEILGAVDERDSETALSIRKRMLTFEDLIFIDRRGFQVFLREVATEDLAVALKAASEEMKEQVFSNLSSRAAEQIKEEMDLLGPMKLSDVEEVQERIVETARTLESDGQITIELGGSDEILV